jgi:hypothetical protein
VANISDAEARSRLRFGLVVALAGVVIVAVLAASGADRWWRLAALPVFWGGAVSIFQWRDRT